MSELFQKDVRTINEHIQNIFSEGELDPGSVIRNYRITAADKYYSLPDKPPIPTNLQLLHFPSLKINGLEDISLPHILHLKVSV